MMSEDLKWLQDPVTKETIYFKLPVDELKKVKRFPAPVVIKHKDIYLICYFDSHYQLADTEVAVAFIDAESKSE